MDLEGDLEAARGSYLKQAGHAQGSAEKPRDGVKSLRKNASGYVRPGQTCKGRSLFRIITALRVSPW